MPASMEAQSRAAMKATIPIDSNQRIAFSFPLIPAERARPAYENAA